MPSSRKDASDLNRDTIDGVLDLHADVGTAMGQEIVHADGLFLGHASAAAILAATKIAQRSEVKRKSIVAIYAGNAFKYFSTHIYK